MEDGYLANSVSTVFPPQHRFTETRWIEYDLVSKYVCIYSINFICYYAFSNYFFELSKAIPTC